MSTFEGRLKEDNLKFICIDNFEKCNLDAEAFFLSHFHSDHMSGLSNPEFRECLTQEEEVYLYCSKVTRVLILGQSYNFPKNKVIGLEVGKPFIIESRSTKVVVQVELIATGHCPGAVMFLIEHDDESVLYTGDFRINPEDLSKINIFEKFLKLEKSLTSLYLDTQFASPKYLIFPTRQESVDTIVRHINHWLQMDEMNSVGLQRTAQYGIEGIIAAVSKQIGMRIQVEVNFYEKLYKHIEEFLPYVTTDKTLTRVHICYHNNCHCRNNPKCKVIRPCAIWFNTTELLKNQWKEPTNVSFVRVPYATHSSLSELRSFINYVKPKTVYANVIYKGATEDEIRGHLNFGIEISEEKIMDSNKRCCRENTLNSDKCTGSTGECGETVKEEFCDDLCMPVTLKNISEAEECDDNLGLISPPRQRKKF